MSNNLATVINCMTFSFRSNKRLKRNTRVTELPLPTQTPRRLAQATGIFLSPARASDRSFVAKRELFVAVGAFHTLVTLLCLEREGCNRSCVQTTNCNWLSGFFAIAVCIFIDPHQGFVDFRDKLAFTVAGAKFQSVIGFCRSAVGDIGFLQFG